MQNYEDDRHIYYNASFSNQLSTPQPASYYETRSDAIIKRASDYEMAILRFTVPTSAIPIMIFYDNTYFITMSYNGYSKTLAVEYQNQNNTQPAKDLNNPIARSVFSYQHFLDMVNITLNNVFLDLSGSAQVPTGIDRAPYLIYDADTQLISLIAQRHYSPTFHQGPTINVFFNGFLFNYFLTFDNISNGFGNSNYQDFQLLIKDNGNNTVDMGKPLSNYTQFSQFISPWSSTTNYMPGSLVSYLGVKYQATANNIGAIPPAFPWVAIPTYSGSTTYNIGSVVTYANNTFLSVLNNNLNNTPTTSPSFWAEGSYSNIEYTLSQGVIYQSLINNNTDNPTASAYSGVVTYNIGDLVFLSGITYTSLVNGNIGNNPTISPAQWLPEWQAYNPPGSYTQWFGTVTYAINDIVNYEGILYYSLQNANTNNIPENTPLFWSVYQGAIGYEMKQELFSLNTWSSLRSIIFTTGTIPIKQEYINNSDYRNSAPENIDSFGNDGNNATFSILSDYQAISCQGTTLNDTRTYLHFEEKGPYKIIDLKGGREVKSIDLKILWQDNLLNTYPLLLNPGDMADIKLMFRKKY